MTIEFEVFGRHANINAVEVDGEILISMSCYPLFSQMPIPTSAAVQLAYKILEVAKESEMKEAA